ncbi:MAG: SiaB family protein kinase, partial [Bacteroidota bacterium]
IQVQFSGAKSSVYYIFNQELFTVKGDRNRIGGYQSNSEMEFSRHVFYLHPQDVIYLTTDGFLDMPNPKRKRFGEKRLKEVMQKASRLPFSQQDLAFNEALQAHSQDSLQRDDITFMGLQMSAKILDLASEKPSKPFGFEPNDKGFNFYEYHAHIKNADILLSYKGPLTDVLLSEFSRDIRRKIHAYPRAAKKVFAIFMELAQNVFYYSKEVNHFENNDRVGSLIILESNQHYKIITGNLIFKDAVKSLSEKCEIVNSLDRESLRAYKRALRNAPSGEESKGAGIGMVQAALTSANPLDYQIKEAGETFAFFVLSAIVLK